jgi:hypothetical protein
MMPAVTKLAEGRLAQHARARLAILDPARHGASGSGRRLELAVQATRIRAQLSLQEGDGRIFVAPFFLHGLRSKSLGAVCMLRNAEIYLGQRLIALLDCAGTGARAISAESFVRAEHKPSTRSMCVVSRTSFCLSQNFQPLHVLLHRAGVILRAVRHGCIVQASVP